MSTFVDLLAAAITVRPLETSIDQALTFRPQADQATASAQMAERDFDNAPVVEGDRVIGRVARVDLDPVSEAPIADRVVPLHDGIVVSGESSIAALIDWLATEPFLLVLHGRDITGLVTSADLNKQAARTYLYALVAGFEI